MRSILLPFFLLLFSTCFIDAHAQTPQFAKTGGSDTSSLPFNMTPAWSVQYAFHPQDISGAVSGNITRLWFRSVQANASVTFNTLIIRIVSSDTPQFNVGPNGPEMKTDASVPAVFVSSPYTIHSASTPGGWFYIDLQTPFAYSSNKYLYARFQGEIISGGFDILCSDYTGTPEKAVVKPFPGPSFYSTEWIDMGINVTLPGSCQPPQNLAVTGNTVSWDPVPGATAYKLEVGGTTPTFIPTTTGATAATSPYYATGLPSGAYSVHVYAECGSNNSLWSYQNFSVTACDTPAGLAISNITHNSAQMNWTALSGVIGYECAITTSATPPASGTATTNTTYTGTALQPATTYYAHLRAECQASNYSQWTTVSFTTPVCNTPTGLAVTGITTSGGTLNWNAVAGAIGYEYAVINNATPPTSGTAVTGTSYNAAGLNYGATYYLHVRTECATGAYSAWATTSFTTATGSVMPQYYKGGGTDTCNFAFNDNGVKKLQFLYRQLDIPNITSGQITRLYFRSTTANDSVTFTNFKISLVEPQLWLFPTGFGTGNLEFYQGQRLEVVLNAPTYTVHSASIAGGWFYIDLPTPYTYNANHNLVVMLQWDAITAGGFDILATQAPYDMLIRTRVVTANSVSAIDGMPATIWADMGVDVTIPAGPCPPPQNITATNLTANSAQMVWDPVPGATFYKHTWSGPLWVESNKTSNLPTTTSATAAVTGLFPGGLYVFQIHAVCGTDTSLWEIESITPLPCDTPTGLAVTNITTTGADLKWNTAPGASSYKYAVSTGPSIPSSGVMTTTDTFATATGLSPGTSYYLHVQRECSVSGSSIGYSAWQRVNFISATQAPNNLAVSSITGTGAASTWDGVTPGATGYQCAVTTVATPPVSGTTVTDTSYNISGLTPNTTYYLHVRTRYTASIFSAWTTVSFTTSGIVSPQYYKTGGSYVSDYPFNSAAGIKKVQYHYAPTAIPNASSGEITRLYFRSVTANDSVTFTNLRIKMRGVHGPITVNNFITFYDVFSAPIFTVHSSNTPGGWFYIDLQTPYAYSNVFSLVVTMQWDSITAGGFQVYTADWPAANLERKVLTAPTVAATTGTPSNLWADLGIDVSLPTTCPPPQNLAVSNITLTGGLVTWDKVPGALSYHVLISAAMPNHPNPNPNQAVNTGNTNSYTIPATLNPGTTMSVIVKANCAYPDNSLWEGRNFTTLSCDTPTGLAATGVTIDSAYLSWNATTGIIGYEYTVTTSATPPASGTATTNNYYPSPGLLSGTTYYAHVRVQCAAGVFSSWTTVSFTTNTQPPGNLVASAVTYTGANLSWAAVPGATGYQYAVTTSATPPASGTGIAATSYNASSLAQGTTYYLHVRTEHPGSVFSAWSTISFVTPSCAAVTGLAATGVSYTSASLSWNAITGVLGYEYAVINSATPPASGTATTNTSYAATGLTQNTTYYLHVRVQCATGVYSPWSTINFTTNTCVAATGLAASGITYTSANLGWNAVSGAIGYEWLVNTSATIPSAGSPTTVSNHSAPGLNAATTYYLHVRVQCAPGVYSQWTNTSFTTSTCAVPAGLAVNNISHDTADISWTAVTGSAGYEYAVTTNAVPPSSGTSTTANSHTMTGLNAATAYYLHVRVQCVTGIYSQWSTSSFNTAALPCAAPSSATVSNITTATADVSWNSVALATGYEYEVSVNATPPATGSAVTGTSDQVTGLTGNTTYYLHVRAECGAANYSPWVTTTFQTADTCLAPTAVVSNITDSTATISWTAMNGGTQYEYAVDISATAPTNGTIITANSYNATSLTPNTGYYAHLRTICMNDTSDWATSQFVTTNVTSVAQIGNSTLLEIYPNPAKDNITVKLTGLNRIAATITLTDMAGKLIETVPVRQELTTIDISRYSQGVYFLKYADGQHSSVTRIVKQ